VGAFTPIINRWLLLLLLSLWHVGKALALSIMSTAIPKAMR